MVCPKCNSRAVGKIGQNQYFCWDCSIEFVPTKDGFRMYRLEPDGTMLLDSLENTALSETGSLQAGQPGAPGPTPPPEGPPTTAPLCFG